MSTKNLACSVKNVVRKQGWKMQHGWLGRCKKRGQEPGTVSSLLDPAKARKCIPPNPSERNTAKAHPLVLDLQDVSLTIDLREPYNNVCVILAVCDTLLQQLHGKLIQRRHRELISMLELR